MPFPGHWRHVTGSDQLDRIVAERQADRLPSVAGAVVRCGEIAWRCAVGTADYDQGLDATPETQYRIGSITKTFTATAVMQLHVAGRLDLDDRLEQHLDGIANGTPTIRRLLSHLSGLQREAGEMFVTGASPSEDELIAAMSEVELVLPPARGHHYSNLAFALLGRLVAGKTGMPYTDYVDEHVIRPLGLERTTWRPVPPKAQGYLVDEYARTVWREPETDLGATAPAGQLWSTVEDLCRWATFLATGRDDVLPPSAIEQMWAPQAMHYPDQWVLGWGLGLMLFNHEGTIYGGHGGAMAGHLAGVYVDRKTRIGAAALTNSGTRANVDLLCLELAAKARELWPPPIEPWRPEEEPPADVRPLLGRWWSEGNEFVFWWEGGALRAKVVGSPAGRAETTFERDGDGWRAAAGRERGERMRVERRPPDLVGLPVHAHAGTLRQLSAYAATAPAYAAASRKPSHRFDSPSRVTAHASIGGEPQRRDLDGSERKGQVVGEQQRDERHGRGDEERDLHRGGDGDLGRELRVAPARDHDRAAVLGGVADDRDDHDGDEEVAEADGLAEVLQRADEHLRDEGGRERRDAEREQRAAQRPGALVGLLLACRVAVNPQVDEGDPPVGAEQHDRHRDRHEHQRIAVGRSVPSRNRRDQQEEDGAPDRRELPEDRACVDRARGRPRSLRSRGRAAGSRPPTR